MRRRGNAVKAIATGLVISFLAATLGLLALAPGGDDGGADLEGAAGELVELLDRRDEATYHAKYEAASTGPNTPALVLETWQSPPRVRQDTEISVGGQVIKARVLVTGDGRVRCSQRNNDPWACRPAGSTEADADPLATFRARLGQGTITARDDRVDGRDVRCFALATSEGTSDLCAVEDTGVPVQIEGGGTTLRLIALDAAVDDDLFTPPAAVAS